MKPFLFLGLLLFAIPACSQESTPASQDREQQLKRLEEQIELNKDKYNRYPRRLFVGTKTTEEVTRYLRPILSKIEKIGTLNYPWQARGKVYGTVVVSFEIRASGELGDVKIERSSGHEILDKA